MTIQRSPEAHPHILLGVFLFITDSVRKSPSK